MKDKKLNSFGTIEVKRENWFQRTNNRDSIVYDTCIGEICVNKRIHDLFGREFKIVRILHDDFTLHISFVGINGDALLGGGTLSQMFIWGYHTSTEYEKPLKGVVNNF